MTEESRPDRYARQVRFLPLGEAGQARLAQARVLVCGCGALGTVAANLLVRAGVGRVRIVDRDYVELTNLQRQVLFDEADAAAGAPKAVAAAEKLRRVNSTVEIEPLIADLDHTNVEALCRGVDVIVDGTDNFETRLLINDAALAWDIPWVYGGVLGAEGQTLTILPGETPCLACLIGDAPPAGALPTCDTAGVLGPAVSLVASLEALEALKILSGHRAACRQGLAVVDLWENQWRTIRLDRLAGQDCRACGRREFDWLEGRRGSHSAVLCGRNAVQLAPPTPGAIDLDALAQKLSGLGQVVATPFLVRFFVERFQVTVFGDGRAIIAGTDEIAVAKRVYAQYLGA